MTADRADGCLLCGGPQEDCLALDGRFSLARCGGCGHVATQPPLPTGERAAYYPPE